jgi:hypothetical protein
VDECKPLELGNHRLHIEGFDGLESIPAGTLRPSPPPSVPLVEVCSSCSYFPCSCVCVERILVE